MWLGQLVLSSVMWFFNMVTEGKKTHSFFFSKSLFRARSCTLDMGNITNLRCVMTQLKTQFPKQVVIAPNLDPKVCL